MKRRSKVWGCFLCIFIAGVLFGCASSTPDSENEGTAEEITRGTESSQEETAAEETPAEETVPEKVCLLNLEKKLEEQYEWDEVQPVILAMSTYSTVHLQKEDEAMYPELAGVLEELALLQKNSMEDEYENLLSFGREEMQADSENFRTQRSNLDMHVRRADSTAVSLLADSYLDCAFVNEFYGKIGYNFDTETGRELQITDVVLDMSRIPKLVLAELSSHMWSGEFYSETAVADYFRDTAKEDLAWTLDYNGVTFYFGAGTLAEEGFGSMTATIPFAGNEELFAEKYRQIPESYMVRLSMDSSFFTELDEDGICEELIVSGSYDPEGRYYTDFGIYTDTDAYYHYEEFYCYGFRPYYVKTAEGHHFLYVFADGTESFHRKMTMVIFRLDGGVFERVGECYMGPYYRQEQETLTDIFYVPSNPEQLYLDEFGGGFWEEQFVDGVYYGEEPKAYRVDENGIPQPVNGDDSTVALYPEEQCDIELDIVFDEERMRGIELSPEIPSSTIWLSHMMKDAESGECTYYPVYDSEKETMIDLAVSFAEDGTGWIREGEEKTELVWECQDDVCGVAETSDGTQMRFEFYRVEDAAPEEDILWMRLVKDDKIIWFY